MLLASRGDPLLQADDPSAERRAGGEKIPHLLVLEDSPLDVELVLRELREAGLLFTWKAVAGREEFERALEDKPDLILADYNLPQYNSEDALRALARRGLVIPFILVSGSIGEETAVQCLKDGAMDYVCKDRLSRLPSAVRKALAYHDLMEEKEAAESARQEHLNLIQAILEGTTDAIWAKDLAGRFLIVNTAAASLMDRLPHEIIGRLDKDLLPSDHLSAGQEKEAVILERGAPITGEETAVLGARERIFWSTRGIFRDAQKQVAGTFCIAHEVTEIKKAEANLLQAQRLESIGRMASGIAHDLNNILAPIMMASQMLRMNLPPEERENLYELIETNAHRGSETVKQVLTFCRGAEGERQLIQPRYILREISRIIKQSFPKNILVHEHSPADLWMIAANPTQLHQILLNLCLNARDAMPKGGQLTLTAENSNPAAGCESGECFVCFKVKDSGEGIPDHIRDRVFEPFFTTKPQGRGTGLGLSTVLGLVKSHGGKVNFESKPGMGTLFEVRLPAVPGAAGGPVKDEPELPAGRGQLILVVDDEAAIRQATCEILNSHGYNTITASDGPEAVAIMARQADRIDALLTDMKMPIMDGVSVIKAVKTIKPDIKVLACSGSEREEFFDLPGLGINGFLSKPYPARALLNLLQQILAAH